MTGVAPEQGLAARVRAGVMWSALSNLTLRMGTLVTGIFLARILTPEAFGVFAIALTVQAVLMTVSELGLAADLVRHGRFAERGPTIATVALVSSGALTIGVWLGAPSIAGFLGSTDATSVVRVMSLTLLLAGIAVVPYARLQRDLRQKDLFRIEVVAFVISTGLSIGLAVLGWGAMAIAVGRLCAMVAVVVLEYAVTRTTPRFGWNSSVASSGLRFGLPLSLAGLLSLTLLSVDNAMVGRLEGATILGLYALAFNVSSWPSSVIGTAIRAVAMPAFAQQSDHAGRIDPVMLVRSSALAWAIAVPVSTALGILAAPVVSLLYGHQWDRAATVLTWLAALGALRILVDVWVAYLTASGRSGLLLACQGIWLAALFPTMWWSIGRHGLEGAGAAHLAVGLVVVVPAFLVALRLSGVRVGAFARPLLLPVLAALPAGAAGLIAVRTASEPWMQVLAGGTTIAGVYTVLLGRWALGLLPAGSTPLRSTPAVPPRHRASPGAVTTTHTPVPAPVGARRGDR